MTNQPISDIPGKVPDIPSLTGGAGGRTRSADDVLASFISASGSDPPSGVVPFRTEEPPQSHDNKNVDTVNHPIHHHQLNQGVKNTVELGSVASLASGLPTEQDHTNTHVAQIHSSNDNDTIKNVVTSASLNPVDLLFPSLAQDPPLFSLPDPPSLPPPLPSRPHLPPSSFSLPSSVPSSYPSAANPSAPHLPLSTSSPPRSVFAVPTPLSRNLSLAKYNACILGLSLEYQFIAEFFAIKEIELTRHYIINFYDHVLKHFDKDHQGGESVFIQSLKSKKTVSPPRSRIQSFLNLGLSAPIKAALYSSSNVSLGN